MGSDERLLALLRDAGHGFVSGERIAEALGVSRAAVQKRVAELRRRGFAIFASSRVGYRLDGAPDALTEPVVAPRLTTRWLGRAWRHLDRCVSTNDEAARWARAGAPTGAVVVAEAQERGRGRLGRIWHSPPSTNLHFSVVLRPPLPPHQVPPVTLAAAVALAETVEPLFDDPARVELKWPNDLLVDGKKAAGILTEMSCELDRVEQLVLGIGVNLNTREFPVGLAPIATSLALARGAPVDRAAFVAVLCASLEAWHDRFLDGGASEVARGWRRFARFFQKRITVQSGSERLCGVAEDIDDDGALRLRTDEGRIVRVVSGEVTP